MVWDNNEKIVVKALYWLTECLQLVQESATKEAKRQKLHPVLGDSLQYGLDLTHYMAIIDNPEPMMSHIGCEERMGVPRQAAGQRIPIDCDEEPDLDCLGSYVGDVLVS